MRKSYEQYKPTKKQVIFPIVLFIVAFLIGGSCLFVAKSLGGETERIIFKAPTSETVLLDEEGSYTIYLAKETTFEGEHYTVPDEYDGLDIKVMHNEKQMKLNAPENIYLYGEEGDQYMDAYTFMVEETGEYTLDCQFKDKTLEKAILSISKTREHIAAILGLTLIGSMAIILGGCQLIGYLLYNGINYGVYYFKKTQGI